MAYIECAPMGVLKSACKVNRPFYLYGRDSDRCPSKPVLFILTEPLLLLLLQLHGVLLSQLFGKIMRDSVIWR